MEANLENIDVYKKKLNDNTRTIKLQLESYMKKALDVVRSTRKARDTLAFRKEHYKAKKLLEKLNSYTNDLLLDMKQANLLAIEIITVPFLPEIDDEMQMQFEMVFLDGSSPWHFWLGHTQKDTATKLNNLLNERLTNLQQVDESPNPGDYVFCKQDDKLVRGFVQLKHAESRYHILDIDSGTTIMTRLKRLFKMDAEISLIPQQALKCTLIEDSKDSSLWTKELMELFLCSIRQCKLTVKIIGYNQDYPPRFQVEMKAQDTEEDTENIVDVGKWVADRINPALKSGRSLSPVMDMFSIQDAEEDNNSEESQTSPTEPPQDDDIEVVSRTHEKICPEIVAVSAPPATINNAQNPNHGEDCASNVIEVPSSVANSKELPRRDDPATLTSNVMSEYPRRDDPVSQTTDVMSVNNPALPLLQNINLMNLMSGYPSVPVLPNGMPFMGYPFNMNCLLPTPPIQVHGYPAANQSLGSANLRSTYDFPPPPIQVSGGYPAANQSLGSEKTRSTNDLTTPPPPPPPIHVSGGYPAANQSLGTAKTRSTNDLTTPPPLPPPIHVSGGYPAANQSLGSAKTRSTNDLTTPPPPPPPIHVSGGYPAANQSLGSEKTRSTNDLTTPPPPPPPIHVSGGYPAANQSPGCVNSRSITYFKPNQAVKPNRVPFNYKLKTPVVHVRPNEELRAICSYVVSPHEFYVQLDNMNNSKVAVLQGELEMFYSNCNPVKWRMNPKSKYCACKYIWCEDQPSLGHPAPITTWYRGQVINLRGNEALVYLVDFGVKVFRKIEDLRDLNEHFFSLDKMAQRCHLQNVPKIENEIDSKDVAKYFTSLLTTKEPLKMTVVNNSCSIMNSLEVVVKIQDESINDKIIEYIGMKALFREQNKWSPTPNYFAETKRLGHVNDNTLMATSGCIPIDEETICSFYRETGRCPKIGCRQIHKYMGKDVSTIDKTDTYRRRKLPGEGRKIKIKVLYNGCLSATRFYGHWDFLNDSERNRKITRRSYVTYMNTNYQESVEYSGGEDEESTDETLHTIMTALNDPYNAHHYQHLNVLPLIGELVIAGKMIKAGGVVWLRGKVRDVHRIGEKTCDMFLIDFGETINRIPLSDLRRMEARFLRLPAQATQFCIAGVEEMKEQWGPNEPPTSIISQWEHKILYGTVTKRNNDEDYVEVDLKEGNGQSFRHKLQQTGKYRLVAIDVDNQSTG